MNVKLEYKNIKNVIFFKALQCFTGKIINTFIRDVKELNIYV